MKEQKTVMQKPAILVCGHAISEHGQLLEQLDQFACVEAVAEMGFLMPMLKEKAFVLVLLEASGKSRYTIDLIKAIKADHPQVKIIVVDGDGDNETIVQALAAGVNDVYRKPYIRDLIVERIKFLMQERNKN